MIPTKTLIIVIVAILVIALAIGVLYPYMVNIFHRESKCKIRVGTSPDFPPFEYIDDKGNIVGIDIDMMKILSNKIGCDMEIVSIDFNGLIPALINNQIDVIASGMTITEERAKVVAFTKPYWSADQAIVIRKDANINPQSLNDLVNLRVGVQSGTTAEQMISEFVSSTGKNINMVSYQSYVLAIQDLLAGRLDAVVVDSPVANMFVKQYNVKISNIITTNESYGLAVRKDNTELLNKLNKALDEFLNSDEWQQILRKYLG
ncbi:extracellular solute-binding protein family 3 [Ignisphaera aggregans DSM 17230]|uniref:Extracellular solute-binding protein family 3 n=1 Tax=Ignisphaera aggregans (strain DSM 17230 / JCM 13409 / AQ1.S1) TaxID=583356 RepID=E0SRA6_IGNAA|nr:extracellular solute-binding protein family 3 [Ignisphaera aggregans DSM 17230]